MVLHNSVLDDQNLIHNSENTHKNENVMTDFSNRYFLLSYLHNTIMSVNYPELILLQRECAVLSLLSSTILSHC